MKIEVKTVDHTEYVSDIVTFEEGGCYKGDTIEIEKDGQVIRILKRDLMKVLKFFGE
jgi:hypothetical protein